MGVEELRDAVGGICMTEEMKKAVIDNVRKRTKRPEEYRRNRKYRRYRRTRMGRL